MMRLFVATVITASAVAGHAQGTLWFINLDPAQGVDAPFYQSDGMTKLAGPQYMAELLAGPSAGGLVSVATTGFLAPPTGIAGYFNGGAQNVPGVPQFGTAWVQVRAWATTSGSSFAQAQASGLANSWAQSAIFTVVAGTPTQPGYLTGLGTSSYLLNVVVPEPSALALIGLAAVIAFIRIRARLAGNSECASGILTWLRRSLT